MLSHEQVKKTIAVVVHPMGSHEFPNFINRAAGRDRRVLDVVRLSEHLAQQCLAGSSRVILQRELRQCGQQYIARPFHRLTLLRHSRNPSWCTTAVPA